ncbi:zinc finger CHY domain protein [Haloterrigena turkmenica DSM 5511]|uniref:Zinc finger CHY domain protein n=1 Tax=Haloterrigena turkmenica (strain ATCC 51198 / DSM 5511 / JCM 9101 / NCIMB 13204 / VKM B-1734 / 4k) TaxID=543526 RepID=D2RV54_HALTV|nr:CHY zinc finger protein [Haloterrigena turkmenica]ADB61255.1 zinc finger CHY domain protein [Haloterrigena turkmenica DSM 5511]
MSDPLVRGVDVDSETRCAHYQTERDVVAFKFACCECYYPCYRCHAETADHDAVPWPRDRFDEPSVLCGVCETELAVPEYLEADYRCPSCGAAFNPGCSTHADRYFETTGAAE